MWLQSKSPNFMTTILRGKCNKDWLRQRNFSRRQKLSKRVKDGSSSQPKRLQRRLQKSSSRPVPWRSLTALYRIKPNNNNSRVSNRYKNQSKKKFMRKRNKSLSLRIRSKPKRGERKGKNNWSYSKPKFRPLKKLDFYNFSFASLKIFSHIFFTSFFWSHYQIEIFRIIKTSFPWTMNDTEWMRKIINCSDNFMIIYVQTAEAPEIISHSSMVILACLILLYSKVRLVKISPAFFEAFSIAFILALCSEAMLLSMAW